MRRRRALSTVLPVLTVTALGVAVVPGTAGAATSKPTASLSVVGAPGSPGSATTFALRDAFPAGDRLLIASLSYGDGTPTATALAVPPTVPHVYAKAGTYTATLRVRDIGLRVATASVQVVVPRVAAFTLAGALPDPDGTVAIGDLNGDGHPDVITAGRDIHVFFGNGRGGFTAGPTTAVPTEADPGCPQCPVVGGFADGLAAGDFDNDGHLDLAIGENIGLSPDSGAGLVLVLRGDGAGHFTRLSATRTTWPRELTVTDLNGDGKPDLLAFSTQNFGSPGDPGTSVLLNDGTGHFSATTPTAGPDAKLAVGLGDLNGDGYPDLVIGGELSENDTQPVLDVVLNDGHGHFTTVASSLPLAAVPTSLTVLDADHDGHPDVLLTGNTSDDPQVPTISYTQIAAGDGAGHLALVGKQVDLASGYVQVQRAPGLDGPGVDGVIGYEETLDTTGEPSGYALASVNPGPLGAVRVGPVLAVSESFAPPGGETSVAVGDVDGDQKPDVVIADSDTGQVSLDLQR
jgi:hypothetical protein